MLRVRRASGGPTVLSLNVRAAMPVTRRPQGRFEVLLRHMFDRMLHNEALGEEPALRATQLVYAIALPGVLVALFLLPAYHQPAERARTVWAQTADHLFYVTYSFVVLGMALISQWEALFPDLLDSYVLLTLPLGRLILPLARIAALAAFLLLAHAGANGLGALFFAGSADLPAGFWRHLGAHTIAASMSAACAVGVLVAVQSLLVCVPGQKLADGLSSAARSIAVLLLLLVLFLFPLTARMLPLLLHDPTAAVIVFPPFWFLGVYESVLYGRAALPIFHELARVACWATLGAAIASAVLYVPAHAIRIRRLVEGPALGQDRRSIVGSVIERALHLVVRRPGERATFHFAAQTLRRLPRLQLALAMYAGVGLALLLSEMLAFVVRGGRVHLVLVQDGVRLLTPIAAFWIIAGLRSAYAAPVAARGGWLFFVAGADARTDELHGPEQLATAVGVTVTLGLLVVLGIVAPHAFAAALPWIAQIVLCAGLAAGLSDVFFLKTMTVPFLIARPVVTRELPLTLLRFFVVFPAFVLYLASVEPWMESSVLHLAAATLGLLLLHGVLRWLRTMLIRRGARPEELIFSGLGLRE